LTPQNERIDQFFVPPHNQLKKNMQFGSCWITGRHWFGQTFKFLGRKTTASRLEKADQGVGLNRAKIQTILRDLAKESSNLAPLWRQRGERGATTAQSPPLSLSLSISFSLSLFPSLSFILCWQCQQYTGVFTWANSAASHVFFF
jgi:hypothetical protein